MVRYVSKTALRREEQEREDDRQRRSQVNQALGMSRHCPYAFQLSHEELETVEEAIRAGDSPLPIWTNTTGLQMLVDPWREAVRRHRRETGYLE